MKLKWIESTEEKLSLAGPRQVWRAGDYRITKDERRGSPFIACTIVEREFANTMQPCWTILLRTNNLPAAKRACEQHREKANVRSED